MQSRHRTHCLAVLAFLFFTLFAALPTMAAGDTGEAGIAIAFFHETICASCDGTAEFLDLFTEKLGDVLDAQAYTLTTHNTFQNTGNAVYHQTLAAHGLDGATMELPVLFIGGKALSGMASIERSLREYFLTAAETANLPAETQQRIAGDAATPFDGFVASPEDSTLLYFYRITCEECNETEPVLSALPATLEIGGATSRVAVHKLNTRAGINLDRVRLLFALYDVPEEKQQVPIVFLTDTYLSGYAEISEHLHAILLQGAGLNFEFPQTGTGAP